METRVLATLTPANLDLALAVLSQLEADARELDRHWQLQRERTRYEAQRAERQYDAVEPENRLVARTLERRWNDTLQQLEALERAYAEARRTQRLEVSPQERQQILQLAADLPAVWRALTTIQADHKELLRLLVRQIALTPVDVPHRQTRVQVLWHTEAMTELSVPRPDKRDRGRTPAAVIAAIATLAARLGVTIQTIHYWRARGIIPASQEIPGGPWWHAVTPTVLAALRQHIRRTRICPDDQGLLNTY